VGADYLNRISIAVWITTLTLAVSVLLTLPGQGASFELGERTLALPVAASAAFSVILALMAGLGTEAVIQAHPLARQGRLRFTWRYWALPVAITLIATFVLPLAQTTSYRAAGLVAFALVLGGVQAALFFSLDNQAAGYRRARAILNLTAYATALLLFLLVPESWSSLARSAVLGGVTFLLAAELLRGTQTGAGLVIMYSAIVAAVIGEVATILPFADLGRLSSGLLLLLLFYLLVGVAWQGLLRRLNQRIVLEFVAVAILGLALILILAS
jgi:hypothetical protein